MGFIRKNYQPKDSVMLHHFFEQMNRDCDLNMSRVIWEWQKDLPCFEMFQPEKMGMWIENDRTAAVLQLASPWPGWVKADNRSHNPELLFNLIRYGEDTFSSAENGQKSLVFTVSETGNHLKEALKNQGYHQMEYEYAPLYYPLIQDLPTPSLPDGFELKILSDVYDFDKLNRLIWKGFSYEGEVPQIDDDVYLPIKHAWLNYKRELCSVILSPDGSFAAFCGCWYETAANTGYLEPMVTAKNCRRLGLGKACLFSSLQAFKKHGCKTVFVEPDEEPYRYYLKMGFKKNPSYAYFTRSFTQ